MIDPATPRLIEMRLNRARLWRWQFELAQRLTVDRGFDLVVRFADGPRVPMAFDVLRALENSVLGLHGEHACDRLDESAFARWERTGQAEADLILDLAPSAAQQSRPRHLRILYDGVEDEDVMLVSILTQSTPALSVVDQAGQVLASAYPAIEDHHTVTRGLDTVWSALLRVILKAIWRPRKPNSPVPSPRPPATPAPTTAAVLAFTGRVLASKIHDRLTRLCRDAPRWFVAWRRNELASGFSGSLSGTRPNDYAHMRCDSGRYYADPFLFEADGRIHLFVEEFPYATGKGLISVATWTDDGPSPARPVLEAPTHLSYPHVFAHNDEIWMIPESLQTRSVELYRADRFPDRWIHEATLLQDIEISDATTFQHDGVWWMFGATRDWHGSNWDGLGVFFAERLKGPWLPHPNNPILIDSRSARPAGEVFYHQDALWRPAQDCSECYGTGLSFCRIERLDRDCVAQTAQAPLRLRDDRVTRGPHTFNRLGALEVIDLFGFGSALREPADRF